MKCKECASCKKGWFKSSPDDYVCIGVKTPFVINDVDAECTEYPEYRDKDVTTERLEAIKNAIHCTKVGADLAVCEDCNLYPCDHTQVSDLSITIIEALEKQIPKKPIYVDTRFRNHGKSIASGASLDKCYKCPNCWSHIFHVFDSETYCEHCGQKLDWE